MTWHQDVALKMNYSNKISKSINKKGCLLHNYS